MGGPAFKRIDQVLRDTLRKSGAILSDESKDAIRHYLDHDEYEMALEGLLIDLIAENRFPTDMDWGEVLRAGLELRLDQEAVLDTEIWPRFLNLARLHLENSNRQG